MTRKLAPIHPGEILYEDFIKPMGLSMNQLARHLDVPAGRISNIVNGKRSISADTALRLAKYFGTTPEVWLGLQLDYDLRVVINTTWPQVEKRIHPHAA